MTSDLDIYRSANELIKQHGDAADIEAAMRADECLATGDMEGRAVWPRIVKAVEELLSEGRPADAEVN
jgi:microcompartment protein CcmL/EutN